jgi:putative transposase
VDCEASPRRKSICASTLKELKAGKKAATLCREHGISETTLQLVRQVRQPRTGDPIKLCHLEDENRRLKKIVADQVLNIILVAERHEEMQKATQ